MKNLTDFFILRSLKSFIKGFLSGTIRGLLATTGAHTCTALIVLTILSHLDLFYILLSVLLDLVNFLLN